MRKGQEAPAAISVDGANSNTALIAMGYIGEIIGAIFAGLRARPSNPHPGGAGMSAPTITLEQRPWYNPDFNSRWFFVPGVIATLTLTMIVNLTSSPSFANARPARSNRSW